MLPPAISQTAHALRSPRTLSLFALSLVAAAGYLAWRRNQHEPTAEEVERDRREALAALGRITDGNILEIQWAEDPNLDTPHTLIYQYRISGVTYECAQDVSPLAEHLRNVRLDLPIQVRFDPRSPADSIVVAETWSGLRPDTAHVPISDTTTS